MKYAVITGLPLVGWAMLSVAQGADSIAVPMSTSREMPLHSDSAYDWTGFYAGIFGGAQDGPSGTQATLGLQAGVNAQFGFYLIGAEVAVQGLPGGEAEAGATSYGQILGRAGLAISDDAIVYAAGGYGLDLGTPDEEHLLAGAGVEMAVSDGVSVEAQYLHGFSVDGGDSTDQVTFGANWHF